MLDLYLILHIQVYRYKINNVKTKKWIDLKNYNVLSSSFGHFSTSSYFGGSSFVTPVFGCFFVKVELSYVLGSASETESAMLLPPLLSLMTLESGLVMAVGWVDVLSLTN